VSLPLGDTVRFKGGMKTTEATSHTLLNPRRVL
jgi:hypothetical protein